MRRRPTGALRQSHQSPEQSVQELLLRLSVSDTGELKTFEALLRVKIAKGVPTETDLVSLRKVASL